MTIWKRVLEEKRVAVVSLAAALVVNLAVYMFAVRPLAIRSAGAADRARTAAMTLRTAERDLAAARALVTGKSRADQELATFYGKVLPADQTAAIQLTYTPLPSIARKANVKLMARRFEPEPARHDARVVRLRMYATLQGEYEGLRQFIFDLESAPEFVIIDDVTLTQGDPGRPLTLTLELSTYYPVSAHGN